MAQTIKLSDIRKSGTSTRAKLDRSAVEDYRERWENGSEPPAIVVYNDPKHEEFCYWLAEGEHRIAAAAALGHEVILADVRKGTRRDAIECSIKSNWDHGVRRTSADKRRAIELVLADKVWGEWSNRQVAQLCNVGDHLVAEVRQALTGNCVNAQLNGSVDGAIAPTKLIGKDGRKRGAVKKTKAPAVAKDEAQGATEGPEADGDASTPVPADTSAGESAPPPKPDKGVEFDPEKLEKESRRRVGKPLIDRKVRTKAQKHLGDLIRVLSEIGIYEEHEPALSAVAKHLQEI